MHVPAHEDWRQHTPPPQVPVSHSPASSHSRPAERASVEQNPRTQYRWFPDAGEDEPRRADPIPPLDSRLVRRASYSSQVGHDALDEQGLMHSPMVMLGWGGCGRCADWRVDAVSSSCLVAENEPWSDWNCDWESPSSSSHSLWF